MEDSNKRNIGLIATVTTVILCGCPGLVSLCFGAVFALTGAIPGSDINIQGSNDPAAAIGFGIGGICLGLILVAIPAAIAFFTLRKPQAAKGTTPPTFPDEPLPPAI